MNKADKFKLLYIFGISLIFYFMGCVDTSVQNLPSTVDYHSQIQLINLATVSGTATIDVVNYDGSIDANTQLSVGSAYPADTQPFMDIPSGTKTFKVTFSNASFNVDLTKTIDSERKIRLILINPDANSVDLIKSDQRYTWQEKNSKNAGDLFPADTAQISFFNASPDVTVNTIEVSDSTIETTLGVGNAFSYKKFPAANYTITFKDTADLATTTINAQSTNKYTAVLYGTQGNLQAKVYTDD